MRTSGWTLIALIGCIVAGAAQCQMQPQASPSATTQDATAEIPPDELRSLLADMAKAHNDKAQLALYASWIKRPGKPFDGFYSKMGKEQGELLKELQTWAQAHNIDLTAHYSDDTAGRAQKIIEARQEKLVRGDSGADFTRDTLMQMYEDYEWQISLIQALLPRVKDEGLRAYLAKSLKVHEEGSGELQILLKRFKSTP